MKKRLCTIILALVLACGALVGCTDTSGSGDSTGPGASGTVALNRDVKYETLGLAFTIPELWVDYYESNIYVEARGSDLIFGMVDYYYVNTEDYEAINTGNPLADISGYLYPLCSIMVIDQDSVENSDIKSIFRKFESKDLVSALDYTDEDGKEIALEYYLLYGSRQSTEKLTEDDTRLLTFLRGGISSLKTSISSSYPVPNEGLDLSRYITFTTKTLEGKDIDSTVFADYDLTVLNLTAAYAIGNYDESAVMQELHETLKKDYPNVNLIQGLIDLPNEEGQVIAEEKKDAVNGSYTSIVMDDTLRNWVVHYLSGVPCTLFINSDGKIVGDNSPGIKTVEEYLELIDQSLNTIATETD